MLAQKNRRLFAISKGDPQPDNSNVIRMSFEYVSNAISHYEG